MTTTSRTSTPQSPFLPFFVRVVLTYPEGTETSVSEEALPDYGDQVTGGYLAVAGRAVYTVEPSDSKLHRVSDIYPTATEAAAWIAGRRSGEAQGQELVADALQALNAELREALRRATIQLRSIYELCKQRNLFEVTIPMWQEQVDREALMDRLAGVLTQEHFEMRRKMDADFADTYDDYTHYCRVQGALKVADRPVPPARGSRNPEAWGTFKLCSKHDRQANTRNGIPNGLCYGECKRCDALCDQATVKQERDAAMAFLRRLIIYSEYRPGELAGMNCDLKIAQEVVDFLAVAAEDARKAGAR